MVQVFFFSKTLLRTFILYTFNILVKSQIVVFCYISNIETYLINLEMGFNNSRKVFPNECVVFSRSEERRVGKECRL